MFGNDNFGSRSRPSSDWSSEWEAVSRLAATREILLDPKDAASSPLIQEPVNRHGPNGGRPGTSRRYRFRASTSRRLIMTSSRMPVAEIEQASAMLRRSEPALEAGVPKLTKAYRRAQSYRSV